MKKIFILVTTILILALCGCSSKSSEPSATKKPKFSDNRQDITFENIIPDTMNFFQHKTIRVIDEDGGELYCFEVSDVTKKEFKNYKKACKEVGFNNVLFNKKGIFETHSEDEKYFLLAQYTSSQNKKKGILKVNVGVLNTK